MLSSSKSMLTILADKFQDSAVAAKCKSYGRSKILRGETSRAFDYLPEIIVEPDLTRLSQLFKRLLLDISSQVDMDAAIPPLLDENDHIELFIKNIAAKGCSELLCDDGAIRSDFLQLMEWQDIKNKIDNVELISGYVSTIYAQLGNQNYLFVFDHQHAYSSLTNYLNKNQREWIEDILYDNGCHVSERKNPTIFNKNISSHYRITPWVAVTAGIFVLSSLSIAAVSMFRRPASPSREESSDEAEARVANGL